MEIIEKQEAAEILEVSRRTINRYIHRYDLPVTPSGKIPKKFVTELKEELMVCKDKDLGSLVRNLFVLNIEGITIHELSQCKYIPLDNLNKAIRTLHFYSDQYRTTYFGKFDLDPEEFFLPGEILSRLKASHVGVLTNIINDGSLKPKIIHQENRYNRFIYREEFIDFMDKKGVKGKMLFTSTEASTQIDIPINKIDRIALAHSIGTKIREGHKNSTYLFTMDNIDSIDKNYSPYKGFM